MTVSPTADLPRVAYRVPDWHESAACRLFNELDWYVGAGKQNDAKRLACKLICSACPVRFECALGALERGEPHGIWGGLDRRDRTEIAARHGFPRPAVLPEHGTNARRVKHGCECRPCKDAHALYESERRERAERKRLESMGPQDRQRFLFGQRVKQLRTATRMTRRRVAHALGITVPQVYEFEDGRLPYVTADVTRLVRLFAATPRERAALSLELHQLAGTAWMVTEVRSRPLMVMAGSEAQKEIEKHRRAEVG